MFYFSITLRLEIEKKKEPSDQRPEVIAYLESGDGDINTLIEKKIMKKLDFVELSEELVLNAIHDQYLNPTGIRKKCLRLPIPQSSSRRATQIGKKP